MLTLNEQLDDAAVDEEDALEALALDADRLTGEGGCGGEGESKGEGKGVRDGAALDADPLAVK